MSFRGLLRPGQGFKPFTVYRRVGGTSKSGRPQTKRLERVSEFFGIVSRADPKEVEQWKQQGHPITHTIIQRGKDERVKATDILELDLPGEEPRRFLVKGKPRDAGEIGHFTVWKVEEREDLR